MHRPVAKDRPWINTHKSKSFQYCPNGPTTVKVQDLFEFFIVIDMYTFDNNVN